MRLNKITLFSMIVLVICCNTLVAAKSQSNIELNWLGENSPDTRMPVTWGVPWAKGAHAKNAGFTVTDSAGKSVDASTWPLAYWPDGSVKFTGLTIIADDSLQTPLTIAPGESKPGKTLTIKKNYDNIIINTGRATYDVNTKGDRVIESVDYDGKIVAEHLRVVAFITNTVERTAENSKTEKYVSQFAKCSLEQELPTRAVIKAEGILKCKETGRQLLPFVMRLYFVVGVDTVKTQFTFIYNGDQDRDFISGLSMTMDVPMREDVNNRHVMFAGQNDGVWHEAVRLLAGRGSGLMRLEKENIFEQQMSMQKISGEADFDATGKEIIRALPIWSDFKLSQTTADSFSVHKRTNPESCWLKANWGIRSRGAAFIGDASGGVAVGLKDFWQSYPAALEINNAETHKAQVKVWIWSPDADPMDMRHYATERHSLTAIYEDAEVGFSTPMGVARTSEVTLEFFGSLPDTDQFSSLANDIAQPPLLVSSPEYYHHTGAFGKWSLPDKSTESKRWIEDKLQLGLDTYKTEIEQRHWYGFWDYGDIMHAYDAVRHEWRYDVGGFAWDNTELGTNMWLWYSFLRTGRADVFKMAEAMTKHTADVDVHHIGPFKGLGSRHNVRHWGCSAKQVRVSQAGLHRIYYYLTADDRIGDVMDEGIDADWTTLTVSSQRKVVERLLLEAGLDSGGKKYDFPTYISCGPDWISFAGSWFTAWERTGDVKYRDWIMAGMKSLVDMPHGFYTSPFYGYDPETKKVYNIGVSKTLKANKLSLMMGGFEIMTEVVESVDYPEFDRLWLEYCERYNWSSKDWEKIGLRGKSAGSQTAHSKLAGYVYYREGDSDLAKRSWKELLYSKSAKGAYAWPREPIRISGTGLLNPVDEVATVSSNNYAQWSLAAIANLEFAGDYVPDNLGKDNK